MALWTKVLRHGFTNSCLVFASKKALHQCAQQRLNSVPKFCNNNSLILPQRNCTTVSSTTNSDKSDGNTDFINDEAPIEWTGSDQEITLALSDEEMQELSGGDSEIIKKIKFIQLEHEVAREEGLMVPSKAINIYRWKELVLLESRSKRRKFFEYLFKIEKSRENELVRKQKQKKKREEHLATLPELPPLGEDPDGTIYGLHRNTLFLRLYEQSVNNFYNNRLLQEARFGQPFVLDCSYDEFMTIQEAKNCAKQIEYLYSHNRLHHQPFALHLCNVNENDVLVHSLKHRNFMPFLPNVPGNVTSKSYLDIFPLEKLVYLSPHAPEDLEEFSHDDIYIMGCMVDKSNAKPLSLGKAKRNNVRMARLPLDRYLEWGMGNKCLTLDQVLRIMLDMRHYNDWNTALLNVPKRKLKGWPGRPENKDDPDGFPRRDRNVNIGRSGFKGNVDFDQENDDNSTHSSHKYKRFDGTDGYYYHSSSDTLNDNEVDVAPQREKVRQMYDE